MEVNLILAGYCLHPEN